MYWNYVNLVICGVDSPTLFKLLKSSPLGVVLVEDCFYGQGYSIGKALTFLEPSLLLDRVASQFYQ
jgi:hypothetical protein